MSYGNQPPQFGVNGGYPQTPERDPNGKDPHEHGSKLDAGKELPFTVLQGFARAIKAVVRVGTFGANKYTANGWLSVDNGVIRYANASERHREEVMIHGLLSVNEKDGGVYHLAQKIWNDLATLELLLRDEGSKNLRQSNVPFPPEQLG